MHRIVCLSFYFLLLCSGKLYSYSPGWESYSKERIYETSTFGSYTWILTNQNVIRYNLNTRQKTIFDKNNTGIFFGCYGHIYADHSGRVWVSCCNLLNPITGQRVILAMYDGSTWTSYTASDLGASFTSGILNFTEDSSGKIYFGFGKGFTSYWNGIFESRTIPPLINYVPDVNSITLDSLEEIWLATDAGYFHFDGNQFLDFALPGKSAFYDSLGNYGGVESIAFERNGTMWLGSTDQSRNCNGLYKYENGNFTKFDSINSPLSSWKASQIKIDRNNVKWIINNSKVYWHDNGSFATFPVVDSLGSVSTISIDSNDIKWFNAYSAELVSFDNAHFKKLNFQTNTLPDYTQSIGTDTSGGIYCGGQTRESITHFDGSNWTSLPIPSHSSTLTQLSIVAVDRNNVLWVICQEKEVHRYDGVNWTTFDSTNSPLGDCQFYSMYIDDLNRVWLSSFSEGLIYYYSGSTWHTYDLKPILNDSTLYFQTIGFSPGGIAWIAVEDHGLIRYDGVNTTQFLLPSLMYPNGDIRKIQYSTTYGLMFLLSNGNYSAIKIFDGITVTPLDDLNSHLYSNFADYHTAYSFVTSDSAVWMAGADGAMRWEGNIFTIFTQFNSDFCGYNATGAIEKDESGRIYFGGQYLNIYTTYSVITSIQAPISDEAILTFPNPVTDLISIQSEKPIAYWKLSDLSGRRIADSGNSVSSTTFRINFGNLICGLYILELNTGEKTSFQKIIKE